jgi:hypothetical protein
MNRPRRFDEDQDDLGGHAQPGSGHAGPPEHPGIGQDPQSYQAQRAPMYSRDEPQPTPEPAGYDPRHATWSTAPDPAADVYGQGAERSFDPPDDAIDAEVVAPSAPAKRKKGPLLVFGAVFGVAVIAVVISMLRVMTGGTDRRAQDLAMQAPQIPPAPTAPAAAPPPQAVDPTQAQPGAVPAGAAGQDPAVAAQMAQAAALQAAQTAQAPQPSALAAPALPPVAAVPGVTAPAAPAAAGVAAQQGAAPVAAVQSKDVQALQKTIDDLKGRLDTMSKEMAALRDQRNRQAAQPAQPGSTQKVASNARQDKQAKAEASTQAAQAAKKRPAPREEVVASSSGSPSVTVSTVAVATPATSGSEPMQGLNLRAVYPPSGADMQAWVMEGEMLRVVSRGSTIAGLRVLEVLPDRVVTDRGVIR